MPMTCAACTAEVAPAATTCERCGTPRPRRPRLGLVLPDAPDGPLPAAPPVAPSQREPEQSASTSSPLPQQPAVPVRQPATQAPASAPLPPPPPPPPPLYAPPPATHDPRLQHTGHTGDLLPTWSASTGPGSRWGDSVSAVRRRPAQAAAVAVALLVAGVLAVGDGPRTIDGSMTLVDDSFMDMDDDTSCTGSDAGWGYSDISSGTTVVVKDDAGDVIATTSLGPGTVDYDSCVFDFSVEVDAADGYSVEASHRGSLYFSHDDLEADDWQVDISLGED